MLFVDGIIFVEPDDEVILSGELVTAGPVPLSGLNVSLEFLFSGSLQAARILAIFANPTGSAIIVTVGCTHQLRLECRHPDRTNLQQ